MRSSSFASRLPTLVIGAIVLGLLIGWLFNRRVADSAPPPAPAVSNAPAAAAAPMAPRDMAGARPEAPTEPTEAAPMASDESTNWEQTLENILLADEPDNTKVDRLLALMAASPVDAQVELAQHLVNLTTDDYYTGTGSLLTNSATAPAVSTVLMNDLLNRNNTLKLPMLLDVAENNDHPLKDQAREMLELLIQEDHGTNWSDWNAAINTWLANNPQ